MLALFRFPFRSLIKATETTIKHNFKTIPNNTLIRQYGKPWIAWLPWLNESEGGLGYSTLWMNECRVSWVVWLKKIRGKNRFERPAKSAAVRLGTEWSTGSWDSVRSLLLRPTLRPRPQLIISHSTSINPMHLSCRRVHLVISRTATTPAPAPAHPFSSTRIPGRDRALWIASASTVSSNEWFEVRHPI